MARRRSKKDEEADIIEEPAKIEESYKQEQGGTSRKIPLSVWILGLIVVILGLLLYRNKDLIVVGMVDKRPVFSWELGSRLKQRFGQQVLSEMIDEMLVSQEAGKKGIVVTEKEINEKIAEVEKSLGKQITLSQALQQQGVSLTDFKSQIRLRILVEKLLAGKIKVTDKEVDDYLSKNKKSIEAFAGTDSAKQKQYVTDSLKQQKTGDEFTKWFSDLKSKSKVSIFLQP